MRIKDVEIVGSPVTWGVDYPGAANLIAPTDLLRNIAGLGIKTVELGPLGYLPSGKKELALILNEYGLQAIGSWLVAPMQSPRTDDLIAQAQRVASFVESGKART
jgi:hypothetical protein